MIINHTFSDFKQRRTCTLTFTKKDESEKIKEKININKVMSAFQLDRFERMELMFFFIYITQSLYLQN
jgi:hypothetical protein